MKGTKLISAVSWAIASCALLWLFNLAQPPKLGSPPGGFELFNSFIHFSFMLLGGGVSYHILAEIGATPHTEVNEPGWRRLAVNLTCLMLSLVSIPVVLILLRELVISGLAQLLALAYMLLFFGVSAWLASRVEKEFRSIRSNYELQPTGPASGGPVG